MRDLFDLALTCRLYVCLSVVGSGDALSLSGTHTTPRVVLNPRVLRGACAAAVILRLWNANVTGPSGPSATNAPKRDHSRAAEPASGLASLSFRHSWHPMGRPEYRPLACQPPHRGHHEVQRSPPRWRLSARPPDRVELIGAGSLGYGTGPSFGRERERDCFVLQLRLRADKLPSPNKSL